MSTQVRPVEPETAMSPPPWRWKHLMGLAFLLFHGTAILNSARPVRLLFPTPESASELSVLAFIEKMSLRSAEIDSPFNFYCYTLGVNQQWNTFAPVPPIIYSHHSVTADYGDGSSPKPVWSDGLDLGRSGAGLSYDPAVKFVDNFRLQAFQERFIRYQAERLLHTGRAKPRSLSLWVDYVKMTTDREGRVVKSPPSRLLLRTLWIAAP